MRDQVGIALDVDDCLQELGAQLAHRLKRAVVTVFFRGFHPNAAIIGATP
jgi:hypothetical protein